MHISIQGVTKRFEATQALNNVTLDIPDGELVALLGPSGCGKTTLLRIIAGLEMPDMGQVRLGDADAGALQVRDRQIGFVFQHYALFRHMTVRDNIGFALRVQKKSKAEIDARVDELLALIQLKGVADRHPSQLSGGQKQRVALARALAARPEVLLLDEPFGALDAQVRQDLRRWLRNLHDEMRITSVFVTHDQDEALSLADRVAVMMDGRILQAGTPREIYDEPAARSVAKFVGQPNFLRGEATGDRVTVELGTLLLAEPATGPVDVMIRAEDLVQVATGGVEATVTDVRYFGHEEVVTLELPSGVTLRARWRGSEQVTPGDHLRVAICGTVRAYAVP
jgi:sulfate transport system ATP-binding protein